MKKALIVALVATMGSYAVAEDKTRVGYVTLNGGVQDFHSSPLDESDAFGLELGFMVSQRSALQLSWTKINPDPTMVLGDEDLSMQSIDYLYYMSNDDMTGPYLRLGLGQYDFEDAAIENSDIARAAMGFEQNINDRFSFRGELGIVRDTTQNRYDNNLFLGLTMNFGVSSTKKAAPIIKKDPVVVAPKHKDSDGDGVFDKDDQCPNTKAGVTVDVRGCELDSDGDGVVDSADKCPATPAGAKVDATGCRIYLDETVRISLSVKFATNSDQLVDSYEAEVKRVADFMRQYPDTTVVFEGHTDSMGRASYNQKLSERRAKAVADMLVANYNIDASRVSSKGVGESKPIADNGTAEGRAQNRRVEAVIETTVKTAQ
ncbi:OmpA family protein [Pleionea sp. CnH1-48]|uniref:OmpA family protein n=1 Tax=Pleionea sp. CnH1-48 TaxID=2954494 RepID=UPI002097D3F2|nr:OmpA family protein [Pleionea sp. CnH1-48]MCO7222880.1 OmpA family protein [Pleionea sp. CnH1-48]